MADTPPTEVPSAVLSSIALADLLGRAVAVAVDALPPGGVTRPVAVPSGTWVVRVVEREPVQLTSFDEARDDVRAEWRRARDEARLGSWLDASRAIVHGVKRDGAP
jgi:parvulin-like peptidyl-prolyl isomerase